MKFLITVIVGMLIALPVSATTSSTEMGPLVNCELPSGMDYIPSEMCRLNGGKKL
ncbi:hypothetical protein L4C33_09860 [Vibrio makurazakiensis]|uniref:hypothetical protein n=1 Tax=Vibrio makurazakiensis TaxID=2910250 RepID=UPI003D0B7B04